MGKKFLEKAIVVAGTALVLVGIHAASGRSPDDFAYLMLMNALIAGVSMTVYDPTNKLLDPDGKKLVNWSYVVGIIVMLAGEFALGLSINADGVLFGAVTLGIGLALCSAAVWDLVFVWHVSVLGAEEHDLYVRKRFSSRIERAVEAKNVEKVKRLLALVCRYYCHDHDYRKGSDISRPLDGKLRNLKELKKSKDPSDVNRTAVVEAEISLMAGNLVQTGYNNEDVKAKKEAAK